MSELVLTTSECIDYEFFAVFLLSYSRFDVKCQLLFWDACLCHIKGAIRSEEQCKVNGKGVPCYEIEFTIIIVFYHGKFFNSVSFLIVYYHTCHEQRKEPKTVTKVSKLHNDTQLLLE